MIALVDWGGPISAAFLALLIVAQATGAPDAEIEALASGRAKLDGLYFDGEKLAASLDQRSPNPRGLGILDCETFFRDARAASAIETVGTPAFPVRISFGLIAFDGHPVLDLAAMYCRRMLRDPPHHLSVHASLLSLVGPVLSFAVSESEEAAGGPPYHHERWESLDVRTGKPPDIESLVDAASLLAALRQDAVIRRIFGREVPKDLRAVFEKLAAIDGTAPAARQEARAFAVHDYDAKKDRVALRLPFREHMDGVGPNNVSQIGVWVAPRAEARSYFIDAVAGRGFTMSTARGERRLW